MEEAYWKEGSWHKSWVPADGRDNSDFGKGGMGIAVEDSEEWARLLEERMTSLEERMTPLERAAFQR